MSGSTDRPTAGFPPADAARWREVVEKDLKGQPFERLVTRTREGYDLQPLYTRADWNAATDPNGLPGAAPYTRGAVTTAGWEIRQEFTHPDPTVCAEEIREDLERGVDSILITLDPTGAAGVAVRSLDDLDTVLKHVDLKRTAVALKAGARFAPAAALLEALWERRGVRATEARGAYGADPVGASLAKGGCLGGVASGIAALGELAARTAAERPVVRAVKVAGCPLHDAGADAALELAYLLDTALEYLAAMESAGLSPDAAAAQIQFCVSTGGELFGDIAKLRALRTLWARVAELSGIGAEAARPVVHARTSARMLSARDPWVNILRTTTAAFAAGVGGAEIVTVTPFDAVLNVPDAHSRRIARNVQVILQEESHLGWVADPAGGSWHLESRTEALCAAAWTHLQNAGAFGSVVGALQDGFYQRRIAETNAARDRDLSRRKAALTGVSEFPNLNEPSIVRPRPAVPTGDGPGALALADETFVPQFAALPPRRDAEPWEALRDTSDRHLERTGVRPRAFLANLGPVAQHTARAGFAVNFLAAGGIEAVENKGFADADAAAAAFAASGAPIAVICSSDALYAELAAPTAAALKAAGARQVVLAGRLGEAADAWRAAGIDREIYLGCDVLGTLGELLDDMEVQR